MCLKNPYQYKGAGYIMLKKFTPIINCLFGPFGVRPWSKEATRTYIIESRRNENSMWSAIHDNLLQHIGELGLVSEIEQDSSIHNCLSILAERYIANETDRTVFVGRTNNTIFWDMANMETVYYLASNLDDGHGLDTLAYDEMRYDDESDVQYVAGSALYFSPEINLRSEPKDLILCGEALSRAIRDVDSVSVSRRLYEEIYFKLEEIKNPALAREVRLQIAYMLIENVITAGAQQ